MLLYKDSSHFTCYMYRSPSTVPSLLPSPSPSTVLSLLPSPSPSTVPSLLPSPSPSTVLSLLWAQCPHLYFSLIQLENLHPVKKAASGESPLYHNTERICYCRDKISNCYSQHVTNITMGRNQGTTLQLLSSLITKVGIIIP